MASIINKGPEGYQPFAPQHPRILSRAPQTAQPIDQDGLYYLKDERKNAPIVSITDYQEWCEEGWKQQHGTYESATRFGDKLTEEAGEMQQALLEFRVAGSDRESAEAAELLSELGDVLWCATSLASNSSADVDTGLKLRISDYALGVLDYSSGEATATPWRKDAAVLSHKYTAIHSEDITGLLEAGFEPLPTPVMNLYDPEPEYSVRGHVEFVLANASAMKVAVDQQYAYGELEDAFIMPVTYDGHAAAIGTLAAEILLNIAYIAKQELAADFNLVVSKNIAKIQGRIQAGRVDKTDGARSTELL
jgi:NTP pyrophosphatase (non-canonical NTP hydrolase)